MMVAYEGAGIARDLVLVLFGGFLGFVFGWFTWISHKRQKTAADRAASLIAEIASGCEGAVAEESDYVLADEVLTLIDERLLSAKKNQDRV